MFTKQKVAVFVDGCFWHGCPDQGNQPKVNRDYWGPKLKRNVERDQAVDRALGLAGWAVVRLWEHESIEAAVTAVRAAVDSRSGTRQG